MIFPKKPSLLQNRSLLLILILGSLLIFLLASGCATPPEPPAPTLATSTPTESPSIPLTSRSSPDAGPPITNISDNAASFPGGTVPAYEKFEITFQVGSTAQNLQLPYDPAPPAGLTPGVGISVDAEFSPNHWETVYQVPAFYFQDFEHEIKQGREWIYPTENYSWKVRFAPPTAGLWQYRLTAEDATGHTETIPASFLVSHSASRGFIRVSSSDSRYFEYENGRYFPGLGYNMNYDHVGWNNPVLENETTFEVMSENGIELVRIWLSQWGIYGPSWNPWNSIDPALHGQYIPWTGITFSDSFPGSEVAMKIDASRNACMFLGFQKSSPAINRNTTYRLRIRYKTTAIEGPRVAGQNHGFVAKTGGWLWGPGENCDDPGSGDVVTSYQANNTSDWEILESTLTTGNSDYLPNFYLALENVLAGSVYIDHIWLEEDLGNNLFGPNIIPKPWMAHHLYFEQRNSYAFDKVLNLAEENGIYLRPVILEKNDFIFNHIDADGSFTWDGTNDNFYGHGRGMTKVRWLHQAWWRYLQARWGYSTNIHSWELLNEGNPANPNHFILADELGEYMHHYTPNAHLVSTSFWHSFPATNFWLNPQYNEVDFADLHLYIPQTNPFFTDTAQATVNTSLTYGSNQPSGAGIPVIRGETGFVTAGTDPPTNQFQADTEGIWLHNFVWAGINAGGLIESYWYEKPHIYEETGGGLLFDHREHFRSYYNFIQGLPLNNGHYEDLNYVISDQRLRVFGQQDAVHNTAHLWIQHQDHTWRNVVDGITIQPVNAVLTISGFQPGASYTVQKWDPYETDPTFQIMSSNTIEAGVDSTLEIPILGLTSDLAVKVFGGERAYLPLITGRPLIVN